MGVGSNSARAKIADRDTLLYRAGRRRLTLSGEIDAHGFGVFIPTMLWWDDGKREMLTDAERHEVIKNLKAIFDSHGQKLYLI